jgi:rhodanese-related sulfurtransferase
MFESIKKLFRSEKSDFAKLKADGAVIIDVRSNGEYAGGHIEGSINIPVKRLEDNLHKFKDKNKVIITCCASGARSAVAKSLMESKGYSKVYNGGGWSSLKQKIG